MPKTSKPRGGSLQFWPRVRAKEILPSVNWNSKQAGKKGILGFVCYKVGMLSALVKDNTPDSMTRNKQIILPVTILECPPVRIFSVRFYKDKYVRKEIVASNEKILLRVLKVPKKIEKINEKLDEENKNLIDYDDIRIICYTLVNKTGIKKTPDIFELGLSGSIDEKFSKIKGLIGKDISVGEVFEGGDVVDVYGVTKGKGTQGPIKRFGISKKQHKSEKGVRRPGSLGAWTPARVSFKAPMAGQMGFFSRLQYNNKIIERNNTSQKDINPKSGFTNYGKVNGDYIVVKGSIPGVQKRIVMLTTIARPTRQVLKQNYEVVKIE